MMTLISTGVVVKARSIRQPKTSTYQMHTGFQRLLQPCRSKRNIAVDRNFLAFQMCVLLIPRRNDVEIDAYTGFIKTELFSCINRCSPKVCKLISSCLQHIFEFLQQFASFLEMISTFDRPTVAVALGNSLGLLGADARPCCSALCISGPLG